MKIFVLNILISFAFLIGCGYKETEEDKHTEIPTFPKYQSSRIMQIQIDSLSYTSLDILNSDKYYFSFGYKDSIRNEKLGQHLFIIFDRNFKEIKSWDVEGWTPFIVDKDNTIYLKKENSIYKYKYPWQQKELVPKIQVNEDSLRHVFLSKHKNNDSISYMYIDSIYIEEIKGKLKNTLKCGFILTESQGYNKPVVFVTKDNIAYHIDMSGNFNLQANQIKQCDIYTTKLQEKHDNLINFDSAILGNKSYGNHFAFGFSQFGWNYYFLKMNSDTVYFKTLEKDLGNQNMIELNNPSNNGILLKRKYEGRIYLIK